jgi:hypothetical protein
MVLKPVQAEGDRTVAETEQIPRGAGFQSWDQERQSHPGVGSEWQSVRSPKLSGAEQNVGSVSKEGVPIEVIWKCQTH